MSLDMDIIYYFSVSGYLNGLSFQNRRSTGICRFQIGNLHAILSWDSISKVYLKRPPKTIIKEMPYKIIINEGIKMTNPSQVAYLVKHLDQTTGVPCPCGIARRVISKDDGRDLSVHFVDISREARAHYHRQLNETYVFLEGEGFMELNGERIAVGPGSVVNIPPGVVHRAIGQFKIVNIVVPPFDPADEFEDMVVAHKGKNRL